MTLRLWWNLVLAGCAMALSNSVGAVADEARLPAASIRAGADLRWQRGPEAGCTKATTPVVLSSVETMQAVGFKHVVVRAESSARILERNAEVEYNGNRFARISSRASGVIAEVIRDLGEDVVKGEVLAIVDSPELGASKAELLQAIETVGLWEANAKRERDLVNKGAGIEREALEAETRLAESRILLNKGRQRLRNFGLSQDQIDAVERDRETSSLLSIVAPFDGMIVERSAVLGEIISPGTPFMSVSDTSTMWVMVDLAEADLALVHKGLKAAFVADGLPDATFDGHITWISMQLDPTTRTLKAKVEVDNQDGRLRANMFGRVRIASVDGRSMITIPKEAVQWEGCCNIAFLHNDPKSAVFQPVALVLGYDTGGRYEVLKGLRDGDVVVTSGSFILKNEMLKDSVGAGCCEVDHLSK